MKRDPETGLRLVGRMDERPIKIKIAITPNGLAIVDAVTMRPIDGIARISMEVMPGSMKLELTLLPQQVAMVVEADARAFQPPVHCIMESGEPFVPQDGQDLVLIRDDGVVGTLRFTAAPEQAAESGGAATA